MGTAECEDHSDFMDFIKGEDGENREVAPYGGCVLTVSL